MTKLKILGDPGNWKRITSDLAYRLIEEDKNNPKEEQPEPSVEETPQPKITQIDNPDNFVFLESRVHGTHQYPDLYIDIHRLALYKEVEETAKRLNLQIQETAQESDGYKYIGNINHEQSKSLAVESGFLPLNLRLAVDFYRELNEGAEGKKQVYNGERKIIPAERLAQAFKEIQEVRAPWRAELFSDKYTIQGNKKQVTYLLINPDYSITEVTEDLEDCLMIDKTPGISLNDWLKNATSQGQPKANIRNGSLYYWSPRNNSVARFYADSFGSSLFCDGSQQGSDPVLGVRVAHAKN